MLNRWLNMKKQFPWEENKKSGNVLQKPMDSYICGIFDSLLWQLFFLFNQEHHTW